MAGTVITNKGLALMSKLLALEGELRFTRAAVGDGEVPGGIAYAVLTGLSHEIADASIASCTYKGDAQSTITLQVSSVGLKKGFLVKEVGLFAEDPNEGEILYAYLPLQSDPQYIYAANSNVLKYAEFELTVVVGAMTSVTAVINPRSLLTYEQIVHTMDETEPDNIPGMDLIQDLFQRICKNRELLEAAGIGVDSKVEVLNDCSIKEILKDGSYRTYATSDFKNVVIKEFSVDGKQLGEKNVIGSTGLIPLLTIICQVNKGKTDLSNNLKDNYYTKTTVDTLLNQKAGSNAEENQNAFSNISAGGVAVSANKKTDTVTLVAGANVTIKGDNTKKEITISAEKDGGAASTADKWKTARNINGMSVQGDADRINYGTCSTAAATVGKVVACTGFQLITGAEITVKFTVTNTAANPTLNVNNTGAKAIYYRGAAIAAENLAANRTYTFRYNGTQYELVGDINTDTNTDTKNTAGSTDTSSKIFLIGATSQTSNPQTYSHDTAYVGTDGCVYSGGTKTSVEGHTHSYLPSSGGTLTGNLKVNTTLNSVNYQENGVAGHLASIASTAPSNTNMLWVW